VTVLVTGSSGLLGGTLVRLLGRGARGLDVRPGPLTALAADLGDRDALRRGLEGAVAVVHVAALHAPHVGRLSDAEFRRVNVEATALLLEEARAAGVARFVLTSTTSVYGAAMVPAGRAVWVDEDLVPQPRDIYDTTKLAAEALVRAAAPGFARGAAILRIGRCFREPAPVRAAHRLHRGLAMADAARAHLLAAGSDVQGTFTIAAASPFRREDADELLADAQAVLRRRAPGLPALFARRGWPLPASVDRVYDASRAAAFGFRSRYDFDRPRWHQV